MLYKDICKILGYYFLGFSLTLLFPLGLSLYYQFYQDPSLHPQPYDSLSFIKSIIICSVLGMLFYGIGKKTFGTLYRREGLIIVVSIWFLTPIIAGMPFYFSGTLTNPIQAYFESTSGLTATGSTVLEAKQYNPTTNQEVPIKFVIKGVKDTLYEYYGTVKPVRNPENGVILAEGIEAVSREMLFWRSFIQFLGGGGIIVLFVAILPALGVGGKVLFHTEVSGLVKDSLTPRIKEGAKQVWKIYLGLTLLQTFLLMITNHAMPFFDALTISFATLATGGLLVKNTGIGFYNNAYTDWIVIIFMILGSVNFTLYYYVLRRKFFKLYDPEFLLFLTILIVSCGLSVWWLVGTENVLLTGEYSGTFSWMEAWRQGTFQMVSAVTTTGFSTVDYDRWPYFLQALMLILMYVGGMSGSTAGGIKILRHFMLFKIVINKIESLFRPETVRLLRVGNREVDHSAATSVLVFFAASITISALGTLCYIADGIDPETAISLVASTVNGGGMGFRAAGPMHSCAFMTDFSLLMSSFLMVLGRLEFFAILALLVPAFWKQNS